MAMGAYMAIRHRPEQQARAAIIDAARDSGVGLGAASQALMAVINGEVGAEATGAVDYWRSTCRREREALWPIRLSSGRSI